MEEVLQGNIKVYKNGAIFDNDKGRIVAMRPDLAEKNTQITSETSGVLLARKVERKRAILQASALAAVEREDLKLLHGDDAWIAEIGYNMQKKATNIDDPKMVDAARFLLKETGNAETEASATTDNLGALTDLVRELTQFARALPKPVDVADGTVSE